MADPDPRRILVAGDWHGDTPRMRAAIHAAQVHGCDTVLHVGDLGILWPRVTPKTFDLPLVEELAKTGLGFYFVDGKHAALRGDYEPDESGFVEVLRGAWWAPGPTGRPGRVPASRPSAAPIPSTGTTASRTTASGVTSRRSNPTTSTPSARTPSTCS